MILVRSVFQAKYGKGDELVAILMNDVPFGKFENYIVTSPPFIL